MEALLRWLRGIVFRAHLVQYRGWLEEGLASALVRGTGIGGAAARCAAVVGVGSASDDILRAGADLDRMVRARHRARPGAPPRRASPRLGRGGSVDLEGVLEDQCAYHGRSAEAMGKLERRLEDFGFVLFLASFVSSLAALVGVVGELGR